MGLLGDAKLRTYCLNQWVTMAASIMAAKKVCAHWSSRMAMHRQSFSRPGMISMRWRWR